MAKNPAHPVILFDGDCGLCDAAIIFILKHDARKVFRVAPLQSETGRRLMERAGLDGGDLSSIVLIDSGRHYVRSRAALEIARRLGGAWRMLYPLAAVPAFIRDAVYDWVARNRHRLAAGGACPPLPRDRFLD